MPKFMMLHYGYEQPTPEIMEAWSVWFASFVDQQLDQGGFAGGREVSASGAAELPWGPDSITGYNLIEAEDLDEAVAIAKKCPFIDSVRVYEIREM